MNNGVAQATDKQPEQTGQNDDIKCVTLSITHFSDGRTVIESPRGENGNILANDLFMKLSAHMSVLNMQRLIPKPEQGKSKIRVVQASNPIKDFVTNTVFKHKH